MGEDCIDYRMLAVAALYADVMARFQEKMDAYATAEYYKAVAGIPFE
jgi:hypothetical protein